ncbi:hypothetical protein E3G52_000320 [Mycobacteroides abscessus]|uniref:hypothetical protein n=1 Tax=Mycobacteroides abscessus TaxID=36809 RepID=UPI001877F6DF|nr:hypothetical protein [Mycobacteroides abscessus]MBE5453456.1 hypothetical protein [Mycobacteroides abscessus]
MTAPVSCACGKSQPDVAQVLCGIVWECPHCGRRWVLHNGNIHFLEPGEELPITACMKCSKPIDSDQQCMPVYTGVPSPHVMAPDREYVHLDCIGVRL